MTTVLLSDRRPRARHQMSVIYTHNIERIKASCAWPREMDAHVQPRTSEAHTPEILRSVRVSVPLTGVRPTEEGRTEVLSVTCKPAKKHPPFLV